jgi:hypothetical protein
MFSPMTSATIDVEPPNDLRTSSVANTSRQSESNTKPQWPPSLNATHAAASTGSSGNGHGSSISTRILEPYAHFCDAAVREHRATFIRIATLPPIAGQGMLLRPASLEYT